MWWNLNTAQLFKLVFGLPNDVWLDNVLPASNAAFSNFIDYHLTLKMSSKTLQIFIVFCLLIRSSRSINNTNVKITFILPDDDNRLFSITRVRTVVDVALLFTCVSNKKNSNSLWRRHIYACHSQHIFLS